MDDVILGRIGCAQLATAHVPNDLCAEGIVVRAVFGLVAGGNPASVAHNGHVVGNAPDFLHLVGDINDAYAACLEHIDDGEEHLNLRLGQGRGRLVQHNNLGVEGNSFCNFHHLTARNGHGGHDGTRVDVDAEFLKIQILKDLHGHVVFGLVGNEGHLSAAELDSRIAPEPNVVHHATLQRLIQLLMHHGDAVVQRIAGRLEVNLFAVEPDCARILAVNAEKALHQRGFTGAVFAHECMDGTGTDGQLCIVKRFDAGEGLADAFHAQQNIVFLHVCLFLSWNSTRTNDCKAADDTVGTDLPESKSNAACHMLVSSERRREPFGSLRPKCSGKNYSPVYTA